MLTYPKTDNLYARDPDTHKLIPGQYRNRYVPQVSHWTLTEKIDGTNIRLVLDITEEETPFVVRGRSNAAVLPKGFQVPDSVCAGSMFGALSQIDPGGYASAMVVFGEGYGPGIQKGGGAYAPEKRLRIFDVVTMKDDGWMWRPWEQVETVAGVLGLHTVPLIGHNYSAMEAVNMVTYGLPSWVASAEMGIEHPAEGLVARTNPYLFDHNGSRVMFKVKGVDFDETVV